MQLSPAWEAELSLLPSNTTLDDHGTHVVVRSKEYPDHIWKNFILVDTIAQDKLCDDLVHMYHNEFPGREFSIAFGWNRPLPSRECVADFQRHGFTVTRDSVLSANPMDIADGLDRAITIRECKSCTDWDIVIKRRIKFLCDDPFRELKTRFESDKFRIYRELANAGRGHWYIASAAGQDISDVGVFYSFGNLASIEELLVYPAARRRGWGIATIQMACQAAKAARLPHRFITVAGANRLARRLRAELGFSNPEYIARAYWHMFMKSAIPQGEKVFKHD